MKKFLGFILGVAVWCLAFFVIAPKGEILGYMFEFIGGVLIGYFLMEILRNK
jgi:hypothetical protein